MKTKRERAVECERQDKNQDRRNSDKVERACVYMAFFKAVPCGGFLGRLTDASYASDVGENGCKKKHR